MCLKKQIALKERKNPERKFKTKLFKENFI